MLPKLSKNDILKLTWVIESRKRLSLWFESLSSWQTNVEFQKRKTEIWSKRVKIASTMLKQGLVKLEWGLKGLVWGLEWRNLEGITLGFKGMAIDWLTNSPRGRLLLFREWNQKTMKYLQYWFLSNCTDFKNLLVFKCYNRKIHA